MNKYIGKCMQRSIALHFRPIGYHNGNVHFEIKCIYNVEMWKNMTCLHMGTFLDFVFIIIIIWGWFEVDSWFEGMKNSFSFLKALQKCWPIFICQRSQRLCGFVYSGTTYYILYCMSSRMHSYVQWQTNVLETCLRTPYFHVSLLARMCCAMLYDKGLMQCLASFWWITAIHSLYPSTLLALWNIYV